LKRFDPSKLNATWFRESIEDGSKAEKLQELMDEARDDCLSKRRFINQGMDRGQ
ncbi:hypothetical protein HAX54_046608, partial [Datura stramonium]|nr:hypothetical protein [Datura stramonium]